MTSSPGIPDEDLLCGRLVLQALLTPSSAWAIKLLLVHVTRVSYLDPGSSEDLGRLGSQADYTHREKRNHRDIR